MRSEADVVVMSEDNETGDDVLRELRTKQAQLDEAWKKRKAMLKKYPFLERLTTSKVEVEPHIAFAEPRSVTKRRYVCKGCDKDEGLNSSRWVIHLLHCAPLAYAARAESAAGAREMKNALMELCQLHFKSESGRTRVKELRALFSAGSRANTTETGTTATTTVVESTSQRDIRKYTPPPLTAKKITEINEAVCELIVESSIPFAWTSSPAFFKFMHALRPDLFSDTEKTHIKSGAVLVNQPKNIRSRHWHSTTGLDMLYEKRMKDALLALEDSEELALAADGWQSEDGRKVLNLSITVRETGREYYWKSVGLETESESAVFMQQTAAQVMKDLPLKKFKCIIGDNTSHVISFLEAIAATPETSHVTPIGCYAHRFNLLAGDVHEAFKFLFLDLERAINKLRVKSRMRALFDAARKEKNSKKQLETYCPTRWASAHACLHSYVLNIDVFRFLDEDQGVIAKDFRKMCEKDSESIFKVFFDRDSQMAVRQLEPLFRGLAAANKFMEATRAHLAEVFPLCWALEKDLRQWLANTKTSAHRSWIERATRQPTRDGLTTPEQLGDVLHQVYKVRFEGLEAQPGNPSTKRTPLRDEPLVHLASHLSFIIHKAMRIKDHSIVANDFKASAGLEKIHFHSEEKKADVEKASHLLLNRCSLAIPNAARDYQNAYRDRFVTNKAYLEACKDKTFVDVALEQLQFIREQNWWRNCLEQEDVQNWPPWEGLIPFARRINAIVPHSASVERMNSAQKLVHNNKRISLSHTNVQKLSFIYFNAARERRLFASPFHCLVSETCDAAESHVAASPVVVVDSVGDDGVGEDEILSSDDDDLDAYLKEADELVMSPHANVSNRTEMTSLGNLDETVPVQDDVSHPARNKAKETFAQKAARKALERQEKDRRSKSRRLNQ